MNNKAALIILDGWGIGDKSKSDAIHNANTPFFDELIAKYPSAKLLTHGLHVGLPDGQMGNSEVGHMNIGAGRVVYQELTRIDKAITDGTFRKNPQLIQAFEEAKTNQVKIHFMGLVSDGGVHSSQNHLFELLQMANDFGVANKTFVHGFTDGRDCNPTTGLGHFRKLSDILTETGAKLATIVGRFYAMDRDKRWERVKKAYDLMVNAVGERFDDFEAVFSSNYQSDITDEFIEPALLDENGLIEEGDILIAFNFRTDRCREITEVLTQRDFPDFEMKKLDLSMFTMTKYDETFKNVQVIYQKEILRNTLGEVVANNGLSQLRIAETEKYPHVSYFFSGGREEVFDKEDRIMVPSPKVKTYDLQPEMSAHSISEKVIEAVRDNAPNFICLNFANTDMVGHTGVYEAIVQAAEEVDLALRKVVKELKAKNYEILIIADHGNADYAINSDGSPNTAHSINPVPMVFVGNSCDKIDDGILADVAPTILGMMGITAPEEMTGKNLLRTKKIS